MLSPLPKDRTKETGSSLSLLEHNVGPSSFPLPSSSLLPSRATSVSDLYTRLVSQALRPIASPEALSQEMVD